jgi:hypothetical protein
VEIKSNRPNIERRLNSLERQLSSALEENKQLKKRKLPRLRTIILIVIAIGLAGSASALILMILLRPPDPIPAIIRRDLPFSLYYPSQSKMPKGYKLAISSFRLLQAQKVLLYTVNGPNNLELIFSVEQAPSAQDIQGFYTSHMPLHITVSTNVGTAAIGAIDDKTVASLPAKGNSWILVSAPKNVSEPDLSQIMNSLTLAQ